MKWFYKIIVFMTDFELQIAQSTGQSPASIRQLKSDLEKWKADLHRLEVREYGLG